MATSEFALTPPTGANQYSDQNYALPALNNDSSRNTLGPVNTGYEMFSQGPTSGAPGLSTPISAGSPVPAGGTPPGVVPPQSSQFPTTPTNFGPGKSAPTSPSNNPSGQMGGVINAGTQDQTITTLYPNFTNDFYNYLQTQMGKGATPFNLSSILPSSGQATTPGALTAPLTQLMQQLQQFYSTGTGGPTGSGALASAAATGNPTDVGPAWQAMLAAEKQNTDYNAANLREQYASAGDLSSSPFANAMDQFYEQNTLNQNAQLTAAEQAAQEAAAGRQLTASTELTGGAAGMASQLQSLDQQSIQNMLAEFIRTSPEYSPLLSQIGGAATTFPPTISGSVGVGGLGGAIGSAGTALSGIADLWSALDPSKSVPSAGASGTA